MPAFDARVHLCRCRAAVRGDRGAATSGGSSNTARPKISWPTRRTVHARAALGGAGDRSRGASLPDRLPGSVPDPANPPPGCPFHPKVSVCERPNANRSADASTPRFRTNRRLSPSRGDPGRTGLAATWRPFRSRTRAIITGRCDVSPRVSMHLLTAQRAGNSMGSENLALCSAHAHDGAPNTHSKAVIGGFPTLYHVHRGC